MIDHPISIEMLEEGHSLLLGQTRSGKTYQARGILERLRRANRRVGSIDPMGHHWGLSLSADGKRPGLDFVIFGGKRAHVPMAPADGARLGRLFVEKNIPAIFDISQWHHEEQHDFVAAFSDAVFLHNEGALHLVIDEAPRFIPQQEERGEAFSAVRRLATGGLGNGIRLIMVSQGWSMIDKTSARMASLSITMRQFGADFAAMRKFLPVSPAELKAVELDLPSLRPGEGYIWDPVPATLNRHAFPANSTFDSSRTPKHGDSPPPPIAVSSELVEELRKLLAPASQPADSIPTDPLEAYEKGGVVGAMLVERNERIAALEARVAELEEENAELDAECDRWVAGINAIDDLLRLVTEGKAPAQIEKLAPERTKVQHPVADSSPVPRRGARGAAPAEPNAPLSPADGAAPTVKLNATALEFAALLRAANPEGFTWDDGLLLIRRRPGSGDAGKARAGLLQLGLMVVIDGECHATDALLARDDIGFGQWPGPAELVETWAEKLRGPGGDILRDLAAHGPSTKAAVGDRIDKSPTSGWFGKGMKDLRRSNLVIATGDRLELHHYLQDDEL